MAQNIFEVGEKENRVLGIVKAKYGLKNKNQAFNLVIEAFEQELLEPEIRPEYLEKLKRIDKEKGIVFKNIEELKAIIEKK